MIKPTKQQPETLKFRSSTLIIFISTPVTWTEMFVSYSPSMMSVNFDYFSYLNYDSKTTWLIEFKFI